MSHRFRRSRIVAGASALSLIACARLASAIEPARAAEAVRPSTAQINDLGPENNATAQTVGTWDVTETVWKSPRAAPVVTVGLIAERRMIGSMLEETLRSPVNPASTLRIDYLTFNRVEGRWEYVSMDTRAAVGMMTGQSSGRGDANRIVIVFQPFALPGPGPNVTGPMLRMRQDIIIGAGTSRGAKDQYFTMADGTGIEWLAHRYLYVRRN